MQPDVITIQTEEGTKKTLSNKEIVGNRCSNSFLYTFVVQQNQFLLGNGVALKDDKLKKKLGKAFDTRLQETGEKALLHGVAWGFWNLDHMEVIEAVKDEYSGFVALLDELTSEPKVGIQFWQIASDKPMGVRLFENDGVTVYQFGQLRDKDGKPTGQYDSGKIIKEKQAYVVKTLKDGKGETVIGASNYPFLPVVPLYGNPEKRSELTPNIKNKIDLFDRIFSDFGDNLDRANDVYWVLNNFGGTAKDIVEMIDQINRIKAVVNQSNAVGGGATAEPRTIDVPYNARATALDLLRKALYQDYMALDMDEIKGGSLTNVAIQTAIANLNLKADRYEWSCIDFVQKILALIGVTGEDAEKITFVRRSISNDSETIDNLYKMREDVPREWVLKNNPYVNPDEVDDIMCKKEAEDAKNREIQKKSASDATQMANNATKGANGDELSEDQKVGQSEQAQNGQTKEGEVIPEKAEE